MRTATQHRVVTVLNRIISTCENDSDEADAYSAMLDEMLDNLKCQDFFGTEAQTDPRGDGRNGDWSMERVEGIDK